MVATLIFLALAGSLRSQDVIDRIVAKVDTDIILLSDIRELQRYQQFVDGKSEADQEALDRLIDQWIVRNEAKAALFSQPKDEDVKRSLERLKRSFSTAEEFEERQRQSGLTDEDLERMLRSQLYLSNYLDSRFRASIQIDEQAIDDFYKTRIVPRAESRGQTPPTLDAARGFIQEALVQRAINEQSERWLKESRSRVRIENLLNEKAK
jgi:Zn-dependent M16 (insulinase) family peptidase